MRTIAPDPKCELSFWYAEQGSLVHKKVFYERIGDFLADAREHSLPNGIGNGARFHATFYGNPQNVKDTGTLSQLVEYCEQMESEKEKFG